MTLDTKLRQEQKKFIDKLKIGDVFLDTELRKHLVYFSRIPVGKGQFRNVYMDYNGEEYFTFEDVNKFETQKFIRSTREKYN